MKHSIRYLLLILIIWRLLLKTAIETLHPKHNCSKQYNTAQCSKRNVLEFLCFLSRLKRPQYKIDLWKQYQLFSVLNFILNLNYAGCEYWVFTFTNATPSVCFSISLQHKGTLCQLFFCWCLSTEYLKKYLYRNLDNEINWFISNTQVKASIKNSGPSEFQLCMLWIWSFNFTNSYLYHSDFPYHYHF